MRAVLLATTPGASAKVDDETMAERLVRQLRTHGAGEVAVITRPEYRAALPGDITVMSSAGVREDLRLLSELAADGRGLYLACADAVLPDTAASAVLSDPTSRAGVLVCAYDPSRTLDAPIHRDRGMVLSVGTGHHRVTDPNGLASGLAKISKPYMDDLRGALSRLASENVADLAPGADAWTLTLLGLVRGGAKLNTYEVPGLSYGRVAGEAGARQLLHDIDSTDEDAVRLDLCVKRDDDLFATYCISTYSRKLVTLCKRLRLTPVAVTWLSILFALGAAVLFADASRLALIGGAVAMYVSFVFDCVDGQLARYTHHFSNFGGWLDMIADRGKEYLMYAGLATGADAQGLTWAWPLAIAAITVQTVRHMADTWYGTLQDEATLRTAAAPLADADDALTATPSPGAPGAPGTAGILAARVGRKLGKLSAQFAANRRSPSYWFKRTIVFPVGERWLIMGLGAAIFDGRIALAALLVCQLIAFGYTMAGRSLRSWAAKVPVLNRLGDTATHRDDGPATRLTLPITLPPLPTTGAAALVVALAIVLTATLPLAPIYALIAGLAVLTITTTSTNPHTAPLDWLVPACLRACEFGLVVACGLAAHIPSPLIFGLLAALALYHYDLAARIDKAASPLTSRALGLGWDGRVVIVLIALIPGIGTWVYALLTAWVALVFLVGALTGRRANDDNGRGATMEPQAA